MDTGRESFGPEPVSDEDGSVSEAAAREIEEYEQWLIEQGIANEDF